MGAKGGGMSEERDEFPVEDEELSTHQEAIPVPFICGVRRVSARWIDDAREMETRQTKDNYAKK